MNFSSEANFFFEILGEATASFASLWLRAWLQDFMKANGWKAGAVS